jgi:hypothetical protein
VGTSGGLISAWDLNLFDLVGSSPSQHILSLDFTRHDDSSPFRFTNIYAPCDRGEKANFLLNLASHDLGDDTPWIIAGDFNLTRDHSEHNNNNFSLSEANLFNDCINNLALIELPLCDKQFTWSNGRDSPTLVRLDRIFINHAWNFGFPSSTLTSLTRDTSDHVPLIATIFTAIPKHDSFRYEPSWALHARFRSSISNSWASTCRQDPTSQILARLKLCRSACKKWAKFLHAQDERKRD